MWFSGNPRIFLLTPTNKCSKFVTRKFDCRMDRSVGKCSTKQYSQIYIFIYFPCKNIESSVCDKNKNYVRMKSFQNNEIQISEDFLLRQFHFFGTKIGFLSRNNPPGEVYKIKFEGCSIVYLGGYIIMLVNHEKCVRVLFEEKRPAKFENIWRE